jgi:hypothetical protein
MKKRKKKKADPFEVTATICSIISAIISLLQYFKIKP